MSLRRRHDRARRPHEAGPVSRARRAATVHVVRGDELHPRDRLARRRRERRRSARPSSLRPGRFAPAEARAGSSRTASRGRERALTDALSRRSPSRARCNSCRVSRPRARGRGQRRTRGERLEAPVRPAVAARPRGSTARGRLGARPRRRAGPSPDERGAADPVPKVSITTDRTRGRPRQALSEQRHVRIVLEHDRAAECLAQGLTMLRPPSPAGVGIVDRPRRDRRGPRSRCRCPGPRRLQPALLDDPVTASGSGRPRKANPRSDSVGIGGFADELARAVSWRPRSWFRRCRSHRAARARSPSSRAGPRRGLTITVDGHVGMQPQEGGRTAGGDAPLIIRRRAARPSGARRRGEGSYTTAGFREAHGQTAAGRRLQGPEHRMAARAGRRGGHVGAGRQPAAGSFMSRCPFRPSPSTQRSSGPWRESHRARRAHSARGSRGRLWKP